MRGVVAEHASFIRADLSGADVWGGTFKNANFVDAICDFAEHEKCDFEGAIFSANTKFPIGFDPIARGLKLASDRPH